MNTFLACLFASVALGSDVQKMPVRFSGRPVSRVLYDFSVSNDLRMAQGLAFDFRCADASGINFGFYARSGKEWAYTSGGFEGVENGKWCRVLIRKENMRLGPGAAGWDALDGVRFSFWCNGTNDTVCEVKNLVAVPMTNAVMAIVRAESKADASATKFSAAFARTLQTLGLSFVVIADTDLRTEDLAGVKIVALPYNPTMTSGAEPILKAFAERGGKLVCGAMLTKSMREFLGVKSAGGGYWPRSMGKPALAGLRRTEQGLDGQPDFVPTMNWGASGIALAGEGRVLAEWEDVTGRKIGLPAVLKTPRGVMVSHVWLGGTEAEAAALMGAVLKDLAPSVAEAVDRGVAMARTQAAEAARMVAASRKDPTSKRGVWCMTQWQPMGVSWDEAIARLKAQGVDFIAPYMANAASACYKSEVLVERPRVAKDGDALAECLAACRRHGVACHVWKMNLTFSASGDPAFSSQMEKEGRLQQTASGAVKKDWLCPNDERNVEREKNAMAEIALRGADGVQFDFIRYNDGNCCYCPRCRARFETKVGSVVEPWPGAISGNPTLEDAWREFRCDTISRLVEVVSAHVRKVAPGVKISGAVFGETYSAPHTVGQDWVPWCEKGWLDFACPMTYIDSCEVYARFLAAIRKRTKVPLYPGIGVSVWSPEGPAVLAARLAEQIEIGRRLGFEGHTLFELDQASAAALERLGRQREN